MAMIPVDLRFRRRLNDAHPARRWALMRFPRMPAAWCRTLGDRMWRSLPWAAHQAIAEALMRENIRTIVFISLSKLRCSQAGPCRSRSRGRTGGA